MGWPGHRVRGSAARCLLALTVAFTSAGCGDHPAAPSALPESAVPFTPEPVYRTWWDQVEACSGTAGPFEDVRWYVVPGDRPFVVPALGRTVLGYWDPGTNSIVVLQWVPSAAALVRHEILHALLRRSDHPPEFFEERCGEVITGPSLPLDVD